MSPPLPPTPLAADPAIERLIDDPSIRVHAIGAGGIGMAGLAYLLHALGHPVTGCDSHPSRTSDWLRAASIPVDSTHSPDHLRDADWAIYSPACPPDLPELQAAYARHLPLHRRGHVLPVLARRFKTLAVAGTHGKTTTSALLAHLLQAADVDPSFCIGGEIPPDLSPARLGAGPHLVIEADESDGTLARYAPHAAVITNIEPDHLDNFDSQEALFDCFRTFAAQADHLLLSADDPATIHLAAEFPAKSLLYTVPADLPPFDPGAPSPVAAGDLPTARVLTATPSPAGWTFTAAFPGHPEPLAATLPLPGRHNLQNALAALTLCVCTLNLPPAPLLAALPSFRLPMRRLEPHTLPSGHLLIADYAHHPTEIRAFVEAVRQLHPGHRLVAIFQPHRYSRTKQFAADFPPAFANVDYLVLAPVYAAFDPPLPGGTSADLLLRFADAPDAPPVTLAPDLPSSLPLAVGHLRSPDDILLLVGAGDIISLLP